MSSYKTRARTAGRPPRFPTRTPEQMRRAIVPRCTLGMGDFVPEGHLTPTKCWIWQGAMVNENPTMYAAMFGGNQSVRRMLALSEDPDQYRRNDENGEWWEFPVFVNLCGDPRCVAPDHTGQQQKQSDAAKSAVNRKKFRNRSCTKHPIIPPDRDPEMRCLSCVIEDDPMNLVSSLFDSAPRLYADLIKLRDRLLTERGLDEAFDQKFGKYRYAHDQLNVPEMPMGLPVEPVD